MQAGLCKTDFVCRGFGCLFREILSHGSYMVSSLSVCELRFQFIGNIGFLDQT